MSFKITLGIVMLICVRFVDRVVISSPSFPQKYWDKFVRKKARAKFADAADETTLDALLGMEKGTSETIDMRCNVHTANTANRESKAAHINKQRQNIFLGSSKILSNPFEILEIVSQA